MIHPDLKPAGLTPQVGFTEGIRSEIEEHGEQPIADQHPLLNLGLGKETSAGSGIPEAEPDRIPSCGRLPVLSQPALVGEGVIL